MKNLGKGIMLIMISLLIFSCSDGEDGAVGLAGQDGVDGTDGSDGETGTANVIYSDWIAEGFSGGSGLETFNLAPSGLSTEEFNSSLILVFGRYIDPLNLPTVTQLPYYDDEEEDYYRTLFISFGNNIVIEGESVNGGISDFEFFDEYRYIIIPGGVAAGKSTVDYQNMSYEEIVEHFNIK